MINVLLKNKILLLIFLISSLFCDNTKKYQQLINDNSYFIVNIDINKDGFKDKVISHKVLEGNELYFINNMNNIVYKGINFSQDGGNRIEKIEQEENGLFSISTISERNNYKEKYIIDYINNNWIIDSVIYVTTNWQDDYSKTYICKVKQNIKINDYDNIKPMPIENQRKNSCIINYYEEDSLSQFLKRFNKKDNSAIREVNRYKSLLVKFPLSKENLTQYNDIAYYLEQSKAYKESIYLLKKIIEKYPERTVAYLNIADAYWGDNNKDKAIENYKIYISQMKENSKENKIPQKVFERINTKDTISKEIQIEKQSLFDNPNKESKTKMYLLKNDKVEILEEKDEWLYILYKGKKDIKAWIPKSAIEETQIKEEIEPVSKLNQNAEIQS